MTGNLSVSSSRYANERSSLEFITGETPEISEYLDFSMYDWVTFKADADLSEEQLGKWLRVSHKVGELMSYWVLPISGKVISCVAVHRLHRIEQMKEGVRSKMQQFEVIIRRKLDAHNIDKSANLQSQLK